MKLSFFRGNISVVNYETILLQRLTFAGTGNALSVCFFYCQGHQAGVHQILVNFEEYNFFSHHLTQKILKYYSLGEKSSSFKIFLICSFNGFGALKMFWHRTNYILRIDFKGSSIFKNSAI